MSNSLSNCCQSIYTQPITREKLLIIGGGVLCGFVVGAFIIFMISGSDDESYTGSDSLKLSPLIVSENYFATNLKMLSNNQINGFKFGNISDNIGDKWKNCNKSRTDLQRLKKGMVGSQIWTLTTNCASAYKDTVSLMIEQINVMTRLLSANSDVINLVYDSAGIAEGFNKKSLSSLLAIKGGHSFDSRLSVLRTFYNLGVRCMSLATSSCASATPSSPPWYVNSTVINSFGLKVVHEMNRLGMIIDISQLSDEAQLAVIKTSIAPVIISNANAYTKCGVDGNVKDDVLKKLKEKGGIIMVSFDPILVVGKETAGDASIKNIITHLDHLRDLIGPESIGIGAGFDGFSGGLKELEDSSKYPTLFDTLYKLKKEDNHTAWSMNELKGLAGHNFFSVFEEVERIANLLKNETAIEDYENRDDFNVNATKLCYSDW